MALPTSTGERGSACSNRSFSSSPTDAGSDARVSARSGLRWHLTMWSRSAAHGSRLRCDVLRPDAPADPRGRCRCAADAMLRANAVTVEARPTTYTGHRMARVRHGASRWIWPMAQRPRARRAGYACCGWSTPGCRAPRSIVPSSIPTACCSAFRTCSTGVRPRRGVRRRRPSRCPPPCRRQCP